MNTLEMYEQITRCEEIEELREMMDEYSPYYTRWRDYVNDVMLRNGLSYEKLGNLCGFSKNTIKSWVKEGKVPKSREGFIKFALGLRYTLVETNYILQRYGKYPKLYSKSLEDAICIYVISHYPEDEEVNAYAEYLRFKDVYLKIIKTKNRRKYLLESSNETKDMEREIVATSGKEDFQQFIEENEVEFMNSYYKLVDYINAYIKSENADSSYHGWVVGKGWNKGFEKMISNLRNWGEVPNRKRLIALGIALNMSLAEINTMLEYANMESLCPKDKIECVILYVLVNIKVKRPYEEVSHAMLVSQYTENPQIKAQCDRVLEKLIGLKNAKDMEGDVGEYIKSTLSTLDLDEDHEILQLF